MPLTFIPSRAPLRSQSFVGLTTTLTGERVAITVSTQQGSSRPGAGRLALAATRYIKLVGGAAQLAAVVCQLLIEVQASALNGGAMKTGPLAGLPLRVGWR
jgi:hypothetical protein